MRQMGHSTHFSPPAADEHSVKLFERDDQAIGETAEHNDSSARPESRLNEPSTDLRDAHVELDDIETRLTALRARQAAARLRASAPRPDREAVESLDLTALEEIEPAEPELDQHTTVVWATDEPEPDAESMLDDDFEKRFAAFAAGESDDTSRRWLDTA